MSLFSAVEMAPRDPILGLNEAFNADVRPHKVNLGVGVYYNEAGRIPLLKAVALAEKARAEAHAPRGYLPIEGIGAYDSAVQNLLFGSDAEITQSGRVITSQAIGGTGALKIGADYLKQLMPTATVDTNGGRLLSMVERLRHRAARSSEIAHSDPRGKRRAQHDSTGAAA